MTDTAASEVLLSTLSAARKVPCVPVNHLPPPWPIPRKQARADGAAPPPGPLIGTLSARPLVPAPPLFPLNGEVPCGVVCAGAKGMWAVASQSWRVLPPRALEFAMPSTTTSRSATYLTYYLRTSLAASYPTTTTTRPSSPTFATLRLRPPRPSSICV